MPTRPRLATVLIPATLSFVVTYSLFKGLNTQIQVWGQPYWVIDYNHGFIKRALVGEVFSWLAGGEPLDQKWFDVLRLYYVGCITLIGSLLIWAIRLKADRAICIIFLLFATSQFPATLAYNTGYLDLFVDLLTGSALLFSAYQYFWPVLAIGLVGPLVHDSFIFSWLTLALLLLREPASLRQASTGKRFLIITAPLASSVLVYLFHSQPAAIAEMASAPLPEPVKEGMLQFQFGQTISSTTAILRGKIVEHFGNFVQCLIFFTLPAILMVAAYARTRSLEARERVLLWGASFAPIAILGIGWDLSRFAVWSCLTALLAILFVETCWRPARRPLSNSSAISSCLVAVIYLSSPFVYAYFEVAATFRGWWPTSRAVASQITTFYVH